MPETKEVAPVDAAAAVTELAQRYLSENPHLADALATFEIAQDEYRKSLLALVSVQVVTSSTTNAEA